MLYLVFLIVEPRLQGFYNGILCQRTLQAYQIFDIGKLTFPHLLCQRFFTSSLSFWRRSVRSWGNGTDGAFERRLRTRDWRRMRWKTWRCESSTDSRHVWACKRGWTILLHGADVGIVVLEGNIRWLLAVDVGGDGGNIRHMGKMWANTSQSRKFI